MMIVVSGLGFGTSGRWSLQGRWSVLPFADGGTVLTQVGLVVESMDVSLRIK